MYTAFVLNMTHLQQFKGPNAQQALSTPLILKTFKLIICNVASTLGLSLPNVLMRERCQLTKMFSVFHFKLSVHLCVYIEHLGQKSLQKKH